MDSDRRQFLKKAGGVTLSVIAVSGVSGLLASCTSEPTKESADLVSVPWPYQKLDAIAAAERGYEAYYNGGCMYGAFEGIIGELRDKIGAPYDQFPSAMMKYGGAGVAGWGTLCGTCNGAAAAIALVHPAETRNQVISQLYGWYGEEALPDYKPANPKMESIPTSVAGSQLCHVSVTKWCEESGYKAASAERADRCAWLTASTVKKAVELLNAGATGEIPVVYTVPESVTGCLSCHSKGSSLENIHISNQTDCESCHSDLENIHPVSIH